MSNYNSLKTTIDANIKQNGRQEITGQILNSVLNQMVTTLGAGYQFAGVATTATNPGTPDAKVFYIANGKGTYTNFGGINVTEDDVVVLYWDSSWHKEATGIASQEKLTELGQIVNNMSEKVTTDGGIELTTETYAFSVTDVIYFVKLKNNLSKVNAIDYMAYAGNSSSFYKVKLNSSGVVESYTLLKTNIAKNNGLNRCIFDSAITLDKNEYIGISGTFSYGQSDSIYRNLYTISTQQTGTWALQAIGINPLYIGEYDDKFSYLDQATSELSTEVTQQGADIEGLRESVEGIQGTIKDKFTKTENINLDGTSGTEIDQNGMCYFKKTTIPFDKVNVIRFYALEGTTYFYRVTYNGDSSATSELIATTHNYSNENRKIKTLKLDTSVTLSENQYIGISGRMAFASDADSSVKDLNLSTGTVEPYITDEWRQRTFFFELCYIGEIEQEIGGLKESIEKIDYSPREKFGAVILYNSGKLLSTNADIIGAEQTFTSYGLSVGSDRYILNRFYSLADRTIKYVCKFGQNCLARFWCVPEGSTQASTLFQLNLATNAVAFGIETFDWVRCRILNATDEFIVSMSIFYQNYTLAIENTYTGESFQHTWTYSGEGGSGDGAVAPETPYYGKFWDKYAFSADTGTFVVNQIIIESTKCDLLMYGDSITEPEGYWPHNSFEQSWTKLIINKMGGRAMTSGRAGTDINAIISYSGSDIDLGASRIANELPFIKPKYVMVTIGTNGGNTAEKLTALIEYIKSQGAIPILNHIPTNQQGALGGYNFVAENATIDSVRASFTPQIKGADFDMATSLAHNGQSCDISDFWLEGTLGDSSAIYHHPNVKGSKLMYLQVCKDIPEIFE